MEDITVEQLFSDDGVKYRVPIYQRHYVWNRNNWVHLWDDIREKTEKKDVEDHFTGVIVIREEQETKVIVDGQQRLTTFQIILCVIRDICTEAGYDCIAVSADRLIRNESGGELDPVEQYKLLPTAGSDRDAFRPIAAGSSENSSGLIHDAYIYFKETIKAYVARDEEEMSNLLNVRDVFLDKFLVVQLDLDPDYEAARVFESLNGRGRALAQFDHLRNNVFLRAGDARDHLYEQFWQHFNREPYWHLDAFVDPFLEDFLKAKLESRFDDQFSLFDLYQRVYRKELQENLGLLDEDNPQLVLREFQELERYSCVYAEIANCSDPGNPVWFYQFLETEFETTSWHPLILLLKSEQVDLGISDEDLKLTFRILESYMVRCMLCHGPASIRRESHLSSLIREQGFDIKSIVTHLTSDNRIKKWPGDEHVQSVLGEAGEKRWLPRRLIGYILFQIERKMLNPEFIDVPLPNFEEWLSIEHVMPENWENSVNNSGEKLWPLPEDNEYHKKARERDKLLQSIGNLTLLKDTLNTKVGNKAFSEKKELYTKHSGLKLTSKILEYDSWDVVQIRDRAKELFGLFCKIWPSAKDFSTDQTRRFYQGVVNFVDQERKFGRIMPSTHLGDHPAEGIFVLVTNFPERDNINSLQPGERVKFRIARVAGYTDIQAIDVAHI